MSTQTNSPPGVDYALLELQGELQRRKEPQLALWLLMDF
jgi:hypothetical protein